MTFNAVRRPSTLQVCLACLLVFAASARAQPIETTDFAELQVRPNVLSMPAALQHALENNPALASQRRQHGIAAARLIIADTYPFNPTLEMRIQHASGPEAAGVTNRVPVETLLLFEVEVLKINP